MNRKSSGLSRRYQTALRRYLKQAPTASLQPATRLGRQAVVLGLETLDMALIHEQALITQVLLRCSPDVMDRMFKRAGTFFAEATVPLEETHRLALEANARLRQANRTLNQRTVELATSNRELKKEIAQRETVEKTLRQSKQRFRQLLEQSQLLQEQLRHLTHEILSTQEEERKKISRELHDVIAQVLTGINVQLATLKTGAAVNTKGLNRNISRTQRLVEQSVDIVHRFARELRPAVLDDLGLIPALHSFMKTFTKNTGIRVSLTAFAGVEKLDITKRTVLFRITQEAMTNVARHAQASRVEMSLRKLPNDVGMKIKDNGKSFDVERVLHARKNKRLGLLGMRERVEMIGGKFMVKSTPGHGTTIQAQIPLGNGPRGRGSMKGRS
ncbi:MAG: histidine kinase [Verrucomicrobiia bacterium]|jgi:signal transduction histidine kinase